MDPGRALRVDVVVFVVVFLLRGSVFMIDYGGVESMLSTLHTLCVQYNMCRTDTVSVFVE